VIGALLLAAVIILGVRLLGGSAIQTAQGDVDNADEFLSTVTQDWTSSLPQEYITLSDDPQCYYVLDDEGLVTEEIACGGARRAAVADGAVWDLWEFTAWTDSDGTITAADASATEQSVTRPRGTLVDASGDEAPDGIADLEAPPLPHAEAGVILPEVVDDLSLVDEVKPGDAGTVITPAGTLTISSIATVETVDASILEQEAEDEAASVFQPAEGEEFRVVEYSFEPSETEADAALTLDHAGQQDQIAQLVESDRGWGAPEGAQARFLASVPTDGEAQLVVSSDGHDQRIDLSTGERVKDPVAQTYYRDVTQQDINKTFTLDDKDIEVKDEDEPETLATELSVSSAQITPYAPEGSGAEGWAEEGKAWLLLHFTNSAEVDGYRYDTTDVTIDWSVTSGEETTEGSTKFEDGYGNTDGIAAIPVPAEATKISVAPTLTVTVEGSDLPTKQPEWEPDAFTIEFPTEG